MKNATKSPQGAPEVKILSETEIQDKLYGGYLGRRKKEAAAKAEENGGVTRTVGTRQAAAPEAGWTGSEILSGELERLRNELVSLRQEKDRLAVTLDQLSRSARVVPPAAKETADVIVHRASSQPVSGRWFGRLAIFAAITLGVSGYFAGGQMLQASPAAGDPTPFTVQSAVYDTVVPAQLAVQFLGEMSYKAYMVPVARKGGKTRYRICVGNYVTRDEADLERLRLVGDPRFKYFKDAFVRVR